MGLIVYGKITKIHGLSGEVRLHPYSRQPENLETLDEIFIETKERSNPLKFEIAGCRFHKDAAILKLENIDSPEDAEKLKGRTVYVEETDLPKPAEDEYYWFQLIGLEIYTDDGRNVGKVVNLIERSLQSLLVVKSDGKEILIPFSEPILKEINLKESKIIISPIGGLLEQD